MTTTKERVAAVVRKHGRITLGQLGRYVRVSAKERGAALDELEAEGAIVRRESEWASTRGPSPTVVEWKGWNPFFLAWTRAIGRNPTDFDRPPGGEMVRVLHPETGKLLPWTFVYTAWITARWKEWALELGYVERGGWSAHELARADGRDAGESAFSAWLERYVEGTLRRD